jgi:hypothetical protein
MAFLKAFRAPKGIFYIIGVFVESKKKHSIPKGIK